MRRLRRLEDGDVNVMVIGHNPGLHELAIALAERISPASARWPPASFRPPPVLASASRGAGRCWAPRGIELIGYVTPGIAGRRKGVSRASVNSWRASGTVIARPSRNETRSSRAVISAGGRERSLHVPEQISDHFRRDAQLAVGEVLDEDRAEKRVVGQPDPDGEGRAQTRAEIVASRYSRISARLPSGDQKAAPGLSRQELWRWRSARSQARSASSTATRCWRSATKRATVSSSSAAPATATRRRPFAPEMDEMRLAATLRTMQHECPGRPIGPSVDPADRRGVAVRNQEVGAAQGCAAGQVEGELDHSGINADRARLTTPAPSARECAPIARDRSAPKPALSRRPQCPRTRPSGQDRRRGRRAST